MNAKGPRAHEKPVAEPGVPPPLLERAAAYADAVDAFRAAVRGALDGLQRGGVVDGERVRAAAADLVAARDRLLETALRPSRPRRVA